MTNDIDLVTIAINGCYYFTFIITIKILLLPSKSSRQSGEYWVDPDGVGVGSPPVRVHCDMRGGQGLTRVGHSLQGEHSISKCPEPGCAVYNVLYDLPIKQVSTNLLYRVLVFWAHLDGLNGLECESGR